MPIHVVEQGDQLSSIAEKFSFSDFRVIWEHADNADLRNQRDNPHVLLPGDTVTVPDKELKTESRPTTNVHTFQLSAQKLNLMVLIQNVDGEPIEDGTISVKVESDASRVKTEAGIFKKQIPRSARKGAFELADDQISMGIGELDPVTAQSGQIARLMNLGYYRKAPDPLDADEWQSAVEEFQCDHDLLPVTGNCDGDTQTKLLDAHGC